MRSTLRAVPAKVPDPFFDDPKGPGFPCGGTAPRTKGQGSGARKERQGGAGCPGCRVPAVLSSERENIARTAPPTVAGLSVLAPRDMTIVTGLVGLSVPSLAVDKTGKRPSRAWSGADQAGCENRLLRSIPCATQQLRRRVVGLSVSSLAVDKTATTTGICKKNISRSLSGSASLVDETWGRQR